MALSSEQLSSKLHRMDLYAGAMLEHEVTFINSTSPLVRGAMPPDIARILHDIERHRPVHQTREVNIR